MRSIVRSLFALIILLISVSSSFAQWQYLGSPETGRPINFDADGDSIYVLTPSGIFYSGDHAQSWHQIPTPREVVFPIEVLAENGVLYLSASDQYYYNRSILLRSDDFGETWVDIGSFSGENEVFITLLAHGDTLLVVSFGSLALSYNKGTTYEVSQSPVNPEKVFHFNDRIMGVDNGALLESPDFGLSWDTLYYTMYNHLSDVSLIDGHLWKAENINFDEHIDISRSEDGGQTWIPVFNNDASGIVTPVIVGGDGKLFITDRYSSEQIYFSDNGGLDWLLKVLDNSSSKFFYHPEVLLTGSSSRMYKSYDDGDSFSSTHEGFKAASVNGFARHGEGIWINANGSAFKKSGSDWNMVQEVTTVRSTRDGHFLGFKDGQLKRSADGGANWVNIPESAFGFPFYTVRQFIVAGDIMYVMSSLDAWHSTDNGISWGEPFDSRYIVDFNEKYVSSSFFFGNIFISDDGVNWQDITFNLETGSIYDVKELHHHHETVFAHIFSGLYRLPAFQKSWEKIEGPMLNVPDTTYIPDIVTMESHNDILIAGLNGFGVHISGDNGNTWQAANEGLEDLQVLSSTIIEGEIYIGVEGGVWKRPLSELIISDVAEPNDKINFSVKPVPSSGFIQVDFESPGISGEINLSLIDVNGVIRQSMIVHDGSGILMDISSFSHGIYFLKIVHGQQSVIKKVIRQ